MVLLRFQWLWLEDARRSGAIPRDAVNTTRYRVADRPLQRAVQSGTALLLAVIEDTDEDRTTV